MKLKVSSEIFERFPGLVLGVAVAPVNEEKVRLAIEELASLVRKYCGGEVKIEIIDEGNPEVTF